jgi:hypothetical protein
MGSDGVPPIASGTSNSEHAFSSPIPSNYSPQPVASYKPPVIFSSVTHESPKSGPSPETSIKDSSVGYGGTSAFSPPYSVTYPSFTPSILCSNCSDMKGTLVDTAHTAVSANTDSSFSASCTACSTCTDTLAPSASSYNPAETPGNKLDQSSIIAAASSEADFNLPSGTTAPTEKTSTVATGTMAVYTGAASSSISQQGLAGIFGLLALLL